MITAPQTHAEDEGLRKNIEAQQNTVTILQADIARLKNTVNAETYTIGELLKQKEELNSEIGTLEIQKTTLGNGVIAIQATVDMTKAELAKLQKEVASFSTERDQQTQMLATRELAVTQREADVFQINQDNIAKASELATKENDLVDKHNAIKALAAKLS